MKTIALEELAAETILSFCENLAELGCPRNAEPDMWFRNLRYILKKIEEMLNDGSVSFSGLMSLIQYDDYKTSKPCDQCGDIVSTTTWQI